ncbi:MAG: SAP domain protein [Leptospirales bacterium]|nr:SAP domain protein [Leptospirales bacterium]
MKRPPFNPGMKASEFASHYWYREELSAICKKYDLGRGTKADMEEAVLAFLRSPKGSKKQKQVPKPRAKPRSKPGSIRRGGNDSIDLKTRIIDGFRFNDQARQFFSNYFEKSNFKFTKEMAEAVRDANAQQNSKLRVQDLVNIYTKVQKAIESGKDRPGTKVDHIYRWNTFVRDFNADPENRGISNRMEAAAKLWRIVRDRPGPKVYSRELLKYLNND